MELNLTDTQRKFQDHGMRLTRQRREILKVLKSTTSHPTADWIYDQVRRVLPNISLGTVYRTLGVLRDQGMIMELDYGRSGSRFDGVSHSHYHIVCVRCGRMENLKVPIKGYLEEEISDISGYEVTEHCLEFRGICPLCRRIQ